MQSYRLFTVQFDARHARASLLTAWTGIFLGQQKKYRDRPYTENRAGSGPEIFRPATMAGDHPAKNRIERMHQSRRANQTRRVDIWSDKHEAGEIA